MRKTWILMAFVAALAIAISIPATLADEGKGHHEVDKGQITVSGEILDMACFLSHAAKGPDHAACAKRCVKGGQPMGLLAEDGTVYLLFADHKDNSAFEAAKEYAGINVEITGKQALQDGIRGIEVHHVKPL